MSRVKCSELYHRYFRATVAKIKSEGGFAWHYECDVSDRDQVGIMAERVRREVGDVNILINNAGIMINKQFMLQTDEEVINTINVSIDDYD